MIRIFFNPLDSKSVVEYPITPGTQLIQFLQSNYPTGFDGALRVFVGADELDLADLDYEVQELDNITMLVTPSADPATWGAVGAILINAVVGLAIGYVINLIFAPKTPSFGDDQAESVVYTLSPTRNEARLGQPIASHYGTVSHPPAFASAPYVFYWEGSNDQYVDELLCLGHGNYEIQDIYIGDTPIEAIQPGTVKYWVFDADQHQQQVGRIGDTITDEVANTETPFAFHENVFTSPEVEDFQFSEEQNDEATTPVAISGIAYAAGTDPDTGLYLLGRIEGVDDTLLISGGDTITLTGTTSNNITFTVGSVAPTPDQPGKMTIFQQWATQDTQIVDEDPLSGSFTTNVSVDGMTGGPFRVQKVGATVNRVDCDTVFPQGLFRVDGTSGKIKTYSVELEFTYQQIDDSDGSPIGAPVVQTKEWTSRSRIPLRATVSSGILPDGAYECSVRRVNPVSDDSRITDLVSWVGLKGYVTLDRNAEAYGKVSLIAFRLKASNGIAAAARSRIRVVAKRILDSGESTNPITVVKDIWSNTDYGLGFPLTLLDPSMDDLETYWGTVGPMFNGSYDQKSTGFDAMQSCVSLAGAKVVSDGQLTNVVPDGVQQVRHAMFTTANIVRDSLSIIYTFDADGDFTGNVVEYRDPDTFDAKYVYSPEETANPESYTLFGCTDEVYAQEMANYLWNVKTLRRKAVTFDTELEGLIPKFGQRIAISHTMPDWGQSGVFVDSIDALTWIVDQPLDWTEDNIIIIRDPQGLPSSPYTVTKGLNPNIVVFTEVPTITNQQGQEPTSYAFGTATNIISDFIVTKISPKGDNIVQVEGQVYNEQVYLDPDSPAPPQMGGGSGVVCKEYECDALADYIAEQSPHFYYKFDQGGPIPSDGNNDTIRPDGTALWTLDIETGSLPFNLPEFNLAENGVNSVIDICNGTMWRTTRDPTLIYFQAQSPRPWQDPAVVTEPARTSNVTMGMIADNSVAASNNGQLRFGGIAQFDEDAYGYHLMSFSSSGGPSLLLAQIFGSTQGAVSWDLDTYLTAQQLTQINYHVVTMEVIGQTTEYKWYVNGVKTGPTLTTNFLLGYDVDVYYYLELNADTNSYMNSSLCDDVLWTPEQMAGLADAILQNQIGYQDPRPECQ